MMHHSGKCKSCHHSFWIGDAWNQHNHKWGVRICTAQNANTLSTFQRSHFVSVEECDQFERYAGAE